MNSKFGQKAIIGAMIWIALLAVAVIALRRSFNDAPQSITKIATYITYQRKNVELDLQSNMMMTKGVPIFLADSDRVAPIGKVSFVGGDDSLPVVTLFSSSPVVTEDDHFEFHYASDSIDWLVRTMFHPAKTDEIRGLIQDAYLQHRSSLIKEFEPVVKEVIADAGELIRDDLKDAFAARSDKLSAIGDRLQNDVVKKELLPLFQKEVWPIIEAEATPLVNEIGQEVWNEVSLFSFGWRYLYDRSPLPEKKLTEKKFREFVDKKVKPILEKHTDDILALQKKIGKQIANNDAVRIKVNDSLKQVLADKEIQTLLIEVFKEVTVDNERLTEVIKKNMQSEKAQRALSIANARLDPVIRKIGIALFGHPSDGITPEFAKVLRRRILRKDRSWLTLHLKNPDSSQDRNAPFPDRLKVFRSNDDTSRPYAPATKDGPR